MIRYFALFTFLLLTQVTEAQQKLAVQKGTITIAGTSNVHDWESTTHRISAKGELDIQAGKLVGIPELVVSIKAKDIKSTKGNIMDNKTYDALQADKYPTIGYRLTKVRAIQPDGAGMKILTTGELTIAGKTRTIEMTVLGKFLDASTLVFEGSHPMKMTHFGISPPTAMLGTMKTGDDITVRFSVTVTDATLR